MYWNILQRAPKDAVVIKCKSKISPTGAPGYRRRYSSSGKMVLATCNKAINIFKIQMFYTSQQNGIL